jgi:hypothetical protein
MTAPSRPLPPAAVHLVESGDRSGGDDRLDWLTSHRADEVAVLSGRGDQQVRDLATAFAADSEQALDLDRSSVC